MFEKEKTIKRLAEWIKKWAEKRGKITLVIYSNELTPEIKLLCKIAKLTNIETLHLYDDFNNYDDLDKIKLKHVYVGDLLEYILENPELELKNDKSIYNFIIDIYSNEYNSLCINYRNRNDNELIRDFNRLDCTDLLPFAGLYRSEICELLGEPNQSERNYEIESITYDELEWISKENFRNDIIESELDPAKHQAWMRYSARQKKLTSLVHQIEKQTRYKYNPNIPIFKI